MTTDPDNGRPGTTALREAEERFRAAFENAPFGIALIAPDGRFLRVNQALCEIVGYPAEEIVTRTLQDLTHPDDVNAQLAYNDELLAGKIRTYSMEKRFRHADGHMAWASVSVSLVRDEDGTPRYFISQSEDITSRKRAEAALLASEERTRRILETAGDAYVAIDDSGRITAWNHQAELTFGWTAAEALGRPLDETLIPPDLRPEHWRGLSHFLATGEGPVLGRRIELRALHRDGHTVPIELTVWALREADPLADLPDPGRWTFNAFLRDITERKAAEEELHRLALVDELTGLRNRRAFLAVAGSLAAVAQRTQRDMALLYLDLDNMKDINDRFGHAAGDQALRATAELLCGTFRESDVIARLGGDEFCVLLPDGPEITAALHRLDERIRARPADAFPPMSLSLGLALYHWAEPCPIETLMAQADAAMYRDKARKRLDAP